MFVQEVVPVAKLERVDFAHKLNVFHTFSNSRLHLLLRHLGAVEVAIEYTEGSTRRRRDHPARLLLSEQSEGPGPILRAGEIPTLSVRT